MVEVYGGSGRTCSIVVRVGREGRGWRSFVVELGKVVSFFELFHGKRNRGVSSRQPNGGSEATRVYDSSYVYG